MVRKIKAAEETSPSYGLGKAKNVFEMQAKALLDISGRLTSEIETAANLIMFSRFWHG